MRAGLAGPSRGSAPASASQRRRRLRVRLGRPRFQKSVSILLGTRFTSSTGTRGAATGAAVGCATDTSNPAFRTSSAAANRSSRPRPSSPRAPCPRRAAASRWAAGTRRPPHRIGRGLRALRPERGPQARGAEAHVEIDRGLAPRQPLDGTPSRRLTSTSLLSRLRAYFLSVERDGVPSSPSRTESAAAPRAPGRRCQRVGTDPVRSPTASVAQP
jgi:hypothetical protein